MYIYIYILSTIPIHMYICNNDDHHMFVVLCRLFGRAAFVGFGAAAREVDGVAFIYIYIYIYIYN